MGAVDRERHPWRFSLIRYKKNRCRWIGLVLFLLERSEACFRSHAKSKVDRERRLNKTNHQLPAAIQATQNKISVSVKLQMPLLWIGPKS